MSKRRALLLRFAPGLLLVGLAAASLLPDAGSLTLASSDSPAADGWDAALDALPADPVVLVGFDPDIGTYAEVRPTVRTALADLLSRNARLVLVSLTPEGRKQLAQKQDKWLRFVEAMAGVLQRGGA